MFLLVAAFLPFPQSWKNRVTGMLWGIALIYLLNQVRIVCLFYAFIMDKSLFDLGHGLLGPVAIILAGSLYFLLWTASSLRGEKPSQVESHIAIRSDRNHLT